MRANHSIDVRKTAGKDDLPAALTKFSQLPDEAHVGADVVRALYGVKGAATLWKWATAGRIPKPKRLAGSRINAWNVGDLRKALAGGES